MSAYIWQKVSSSNASSFAANAVVAGSDVNKDVLYVGRAEYNKELLPCKVNLKAKKACVPYGGKEVEVNTFEMYLKQAPTQTALQDKWVSAINGAVPPGAVIIGHTATGESLYMGRAPHKGSVTPGKIQASHGCLYIPFDRQEHSYKQYEVLVLEEVITYSWQPVTATTASSFIDRAVKAGKDLDGSDIFVGRATYKGEVLPAKVIPKNRKACVSTGGDEIEVSSFEMYLRQNAFASATKEKWIADTNGKVPAGALKVGKTLNGEDLYVGRTQHKGAITPGKIHVTHGCLYIPFDGHELSFKQYEVLVIV